MRLIGIQIFLSKGLLRGALLTLTLLDKKLAEEIIPKKIEELKPDGNKAVYKFKVEGSP